VQVGLPPFASLTVSGIGPEERRALDAFEEPARISEALAACGPLANPERVYALVGCMHDVGALAAADLPEHSGAHPESLRTTRALVIGTGPVGQCTALFLAAAGVGTVRVEPGPHEAPVLRSRQVHPLLGRTLRRSQDVTAQRPAGLIEAACAALGARSRRRTAGQPDIVVLTDDPWRSHGQTWQARGIAVLAVAADATGAEVGPLVVPGLTACLSCRDRHRRTRDPSWPLLLSQLGTAEQAVTHGDGRGQGAVMAMLAAAWATALAVDWLTCRWAADHPMAGAVIHLQSPPLVVSSHRLAVHPACGCQDPE